MKVNAPQSALLTELSFWGPDLEKERPLSLIGDGRWKAIEVNLVYQ